MRQYACGIDLDWRGRTVVGIGLFTESAALSQLACLGLIFTVILGLNFLGKKRSIRLQ
jgi:quaternary ammonium compound-resistance protein SugE